jgi:predicted RNA-binding protein with EMAP domain
MLEKKYLSFSRNLLKINIHTILLFYSQITYLTFLLNTKTNLDHDVEDEAVLVVILTCEVQLYQFEPMEKLYVVLPSYRQFEMNITMPLLFYVIFLQFELKISQT